MDELRELAKSDPEQAVKFREFFLTNDTFVDKGLAQVIPQDEIEYYPGSVKGPDPEDDPEAYSKWFASHQPKTLFPNGVWELEELGITPTFIRNTKKENEERKFTPTIGKSLMDYYYEQDELYPMQNLEPEILPQFAIYNKDLYRDMDGNVPDLAFTSVMGVDELGPLPPDAPQMYQRLHENLENWSIFRLMPQMLAYDKAMTSHLRNTARGLKAIPDYQYNMP
jgi:hypothetical protein